MLDHKSSEASGLGSNVLVSAFLGYTDWGMGASIDRLMDWCGGFWSHSCYQSPVQLEESLKQVFGTDYGGILSRTAAKQRQSVVKMQVESCHAD